ncbi:transmembrane domain protein [Mycobacterium kansasii 732]|nr:transmembrane domain protein [Mycobacterium kansasii 732]
MNDPTPDAPEPREAPPAAAGGRFGASIRSAGYLRKWLLLGITIGVIAGLGAVVFYLVLKYTGEFLLGYLADYHIPTPVGEGGSRGSRGFARPWAIPLVTTAGRCSRPSSWPGSRPKPPVTAPMRPSRRSTPIRGPFAGARCW